MPKSRSGKEDRPFRLFLTELRELGFVDVVLGFSTGSGMARSPSSSRVGVSNLRARNSSIEEVCSCASAATLLADREGFMPRIGTAAVVARPSDEPVELRTEERKGA